MIYLIGEIVGYLLVALLLGICTGWLLRGARGRSVGAAAVIMPASRPVSDPRVAQLDAELAVRLQRIRELEAKLAARAPESDIAVRRLTAAEQRVAELERERELQNRALKVLHQQLELATERRPREAARASRQ